MFPQTLSEELNINQYTDSQNTVTLCYDKFVYSETAENY